MQQVMRRLAYATVLVAGGACNLSGDDAFTFVSTPSGRGTAFGPTDAGSTASEPLGICDLATPGGRCTSAGADCELGGSPYPRCNTQLTCLVGAWAEVDAGSRVGCEPPCPPRPALDPTVGCDVPDPKNLVCDYPNEGITCGCVRVRDGDAGVTPKDAGSDGGAEPPGARYVWTCVTPGEDCPPTRPRLGTECVHPVRCDYGACSFDDGVAVRCYSGFWREDNDVDCPRQP